MLLLATGLAACSDNGTEVTCNPGPDPDLTLPETPTAELVRQDLRVGEGAAVANTNATVLVDYIGRAFSTKTHFDSSYGRGHPTAVTLDSVIAGWREGMLGMAEGGCRHLVVPGALGYGDAPPSDDIGANDTLVFDIELHRILEPPTVSIPADIATAPVATDMVTGVRGAVTPSSTVTIHYRGAIASSGTVFQSTWDAGEPFTFDLATGLQGFRDGLQGMLVGGRRQLVLPPELAFGSSPPQGSGIGPDDTLVFVVDLLAVTEPS